MQITYLKRTFAFAMAVIAVAVLGGCTALPDRQEVTRSVPANEKTIVTHLFGWEANGCGTIRFDVAISKPSTHGKAAIKEVDASQLKNRIGTCNPNERIAFEVSYEPKAGYRGPDQFEVSINFLDEPRPESLYSINLTVGQ